MLTGSVPWATEVVFDVTLDELEDDPYPIYERMRRECPIAYVPETGRVLVTTWALCDEAGSNDEVFGPTTHPFFEVYGDPNVMSLTGEAHRETRNAVNAPFRPRAVNGYRDTKLATIAVRYIDAVRERGRIEAVGELLEPICQRAIGDVLGLNDVDDATLSRWFHRYAAYLEDFGRHPDVAERGRAVKAEVHRYLERRIPELTAHPDDSALSHMLRDGMPEGRYRTIDDVIGTLGTLIVGGFQEPAHEVGNALLGVLGRPEQAARLRGDPDSWVAKAIEEGLRWLPPFGMTEKTTFDEVTAGGVRFAPGTEVGLVLASANRDPARFPDPDVFDLDRPPMSHAAFGYGAHFCIGHYVARSLGQIVLREMLERLPNLRTDPGAAPPYVHGWANRAARTLPLVWDA